MSSITKLIGISSCEASWGKGEPVSSDWLERNNIVRELLSHLLNYSAWNLERDAHMSQLYRSG